MSAMGGKRTFGANVRNGWKADIDPRLPMANPASMFRVALGLSLICAACGPSEQPKWATTVAAYEVPVPTASDKHRLLKLLSDYAGSSGYHVDAETEDELKGQSEIAPMTFSAAVWSGKDEDEAIASAMDDQDHIGRVWIMFSLGKEPARSARFREVLVSALKTDWPDVASLPIMPNGGIPLASDLVRTPSGYVVKPAAAADYQVQRQ